MMPEEAVELLVPKGVMPLHVWTSAKASAKVTIDACVTTAKDNETRRCATRVKIWSARQRRYPWSEARQRAFVKELGNDMLITGGLEAEE